MDAQWEKLFKTSIDDKKIRVLTKRLASETSIADKYEGDLRNLEAKFDNALKSDEEFSAKALSRMEGLIEDTERQVKAARRKADSTKQDIRILELQADSASIEKRVKQGIQQFLADDRNDITKQNDFNDWARTLGINFTFVEASNPAPRIRLSSATGSLEMHCYREDGQAVGDTSICDMELFRLEDQVIAQRMEEILKVAEPLRHDSPTG